MLGTIELIGIVLSYLSAQELRDMGADSYIVNLMGIGILRELSPLLAAILNAGRSGSSMTAQIGSMREAFPPSRERDRWLDLAYWS